MLMLLRGGSVAGTTGNGFLMTDKMPALLKALPLTSAGPIAQAGRSSERKTALGSLGGDVWQVSSCLPGFLAIGLAHRGGESGRTGRKHDVSGQERWLTLCFFAGAVHVLNRCQSRTDVSDTAGPQRERHREEAKGTGPGVSF